MSAIVGFGYLVAGFDTRTLTNLMTSLLDPGYTNRQAIYDLRRLRRKNLIERLPHSNRYQLTPLGRRVAVMFTKAHGRILAQDCPTSTPAYPPTSANDIPWPRPGAPPNTNSTAT